MDEQTAIQRLKQGDIGGLEFLVQRHQVKAVRTAYLITRNPALAEDVAQECFIQAYHAIGGFDANRPFAPWFFRSVVHAAIKAAQKAEKQVLVEPSVDATWFEGLLGQAESAEDGAETSAHQQEIWDALRQLSPRQRAVVVQRYYLDMSEKEMAMQSNVAPGTVKWLLNAARQRLRILLGGRDAQ
ncbi:MAG: sigma-70 family RNA polymerase sigma factor [Anaerolineae bacterium]|nr:sigma-70 family RNA polymerase sigma factor [Anaerolineae bacterium]